MPAQYAEGLSVAGAVAWCAASLRSIAQRSRSAPNVPARRISFRIRGGMGVAAVRDLYYCGLRHCVSVQPRAADRAGEGGFGEFGKVRGILVSGGDHPASLCVVFKQPKSVGRGRLFRIASVQITVHSG